MDGMKIGGGVSGQVAGNDIHNHGTVVFGSLPQKPESQLQEEFASRTGVWCAKPARECFEWLMSEHHFVKTELEPAWRHRMIIWSDGRLKSNATTLDRFFGWFLVVAMSVPALQALLLSEIPIFVSVLALIPVVLVGAWMDRTLFFPHRVARRAVALMDDWFSDNNNNMDGRYDSAKGSARPASGRVS